MGSVHGDVVEEDRSRNFAVGESRSYLVVEGRRRNCSWRTGHWWEGGSGIVGTVAGGWGVEVCFGRSYEAGGSGTNLAAEDCGLVGFAGAWFGRRSEHCKVALN